MRRRQARAPPGTGLRARQLAVDEARQRARSRARRAEVASRPPRMRSATLSDRRAPLELPAGRIARDARSAGTARPGAWVAEAASAPRPGAACATAASVRRSPATPQGEPSASVDTSRRRQRSASEERAAAPSFEARQRRAPRSTATKRRRRRFAGCRRRHAGGAAARAELGFGRGIGLQALALRPAARPEPGRATGCRPIRGRAGAPCRPASRSPRAAAGRGRWRPARAAEVVPQAVAAGEHAVADLEPVDVLLRERRVLEGAEANRSAGSTADGCWLPLLLICRSSTRPLHVRVIDRAAHHLGGAEVVDARVAGMDEIALRASGLIRNAAIVLCGSSSEVIAVSLIIRCASSTSCLSASVGSSRGSANSARTAAAPSGCTWSAAPCARRSCRPCRRRGTPISAARHATVRKLPGPDPAGSPVAAVKPVVAESR